MYVDDTTTTIKLDKEVGYQTQIDDRVGKLNNYMNAKLLTINDTKTQLFIISKNNNTKEQHQINTTTKII